eukprot:m.1571274 g.1571274  ORF g.1571274 m.1571274 type:complete len:181 (+) comp25301_c0_seq69:952-1494(+)
MQNVCSCEMRCYLKLEEFLANRGAPTWSSSIRAESMTQRTTKRVTFVFTHGQGGGEEIRIKYDMLPPELDITTAFQDAPPMPSPSRVRGLQRTRHDSDTDDQTVGTSRTDSPPTGARDNDGRSHSDSELHKTSMLLVGEVDNAPSAFGPCKLAPPGHIDMLGGLTAAKSMQELSDIFLKR